jgi:AcrR family transcriptional regulator
MATAKRDAAAAVAERKAPVREKGKRTRARLIKAAERVFVRNGYLETRVADIVNEAGIAHGSFYTYFDSKEVLFREVAAAVVDDMYSALDTNVVGATPLERIRAANLRYLELYERNAGMIALIEQVATFDEHFLRTRLELRRRFVERIERAIERIYKRGESSVDEIDPHVAANALGGMVDNFAFAWFVLKEPFDRDVALRTLDAVWMRALGLDEPAPPA